MNDLSNGSKRFENPQKLVESFIKIANDHLKNEAGQNLKRRRKDIKAIGLFNDKEKQALFELYGKLVNERSFGYQEKLKKIKDLSKRIQSQKVPRVIRTLCKAIYGEEALYFSILLPEPAVEKIRRYKFGDKIIESPPPDYRIVTRASLAKHAEFIEDSNTYTANDDTVETVLEICIFIILKVRLRTEKKDKLAIFSDQNISGILGCVLEKNFSPARRKSRLPPSKIDQQNFIVALGRYTGTQPKLNNSKKKQTIYNVLSTLGVGYCMDEYLKNKENFKTRGSRSKKSQH